MLGCPLAFSQTCASWRMTSRSAVGIQGQFERDLRGEQRGAALRQPDLTEGSASEGANEGIGADSIARVKHLCTISYGKINDHYLSSTCQRTTPLPTIQGMATPAKQERAKPFMSMPTTGAGRVITNLQTRRRNSYPPPRSVLPEDKSRCLLASQRATIVRSPHP